MYREDKFGGGFGVLLLISECGSESRRLSILQIFRCHIAGLSLLLIERRIEEIEVLLFGLFLSKQILGNEDLSQLSSLYGILIEKRGEYFG
ncbi:hypothetical protein NC651_036299 [Populus alba x Populus x berolinensis]|nr:hypothetical protein NC651_036299 [Populus alba x Populus x berolinensis]